MGLAWIPHVVTGMSKREGYGKQMERKLVGWKKRLEDVAAKDDTDPKKVDAWKAAGDAAFVKLTELRAAAARYGEIRDEMETAWLAIDAAIPAAPA